MGEEANAILRIQIRPLDHLIDKFSRELDKEGTLKRMKQEEKGLREGIGNVIHSIIEGKKPGKERKLGQAFDLLLIFDQHMKSVFRAGDHKGNPFINLEVRLEDEERSRNKEQADPQGCYTIEDSGRDNAKRLEACLMVKRFKGGKHILCIVVYTTHRYWEVWQWIDDANRQRKVEYNLHKLKNSRFKETCGSRQGNSLRGKNDTTNIQQSYRKLGFVNSLTPSLRGDVGTSSVHETHLKMIAAMVYVENLIAPRVACEGRLIKITITRDKPIQGGRRWENGNTWVTSNRMENERNERLNYNQRERKALNHNQKLYHNRGLDSNQMKEEGLGHNQDQTRRWDERGLVQGQLEDQILLESNKETAPNPEDKKMMEPNHKDQVVSTRAPKNLTQIRVNSGGAAMNSVAALFEDLSRLGQLGAWPLAYYT